MQSKQTLEQSKEWLAKSAYIFYIQQAIKNDPSVWAKFSIEKQTEIHKN